MGVCTSTIGVMASSCSRAIYVDIRAACRLAVILGRARALLDLQQPLHPKYELPPWMRVVHGKSGCSNADPLVDLTAAGPYLAGVG
eukprot:10608065-Ditylum_brightwellii.AAC.1